MDDALPLVSELLAEAAVDAEIARRRTIRSAPVILDASRHLKKLAGIFAEGTIVTVVGRRDSPYLKGLREAIRGGDAEKARVIGDAIAERARADIKSFEEPYALADVPLIVDVAYGRHMLAKHVFIPAGGQVAMSVAVWSGGALENDKFEAWVYPAKETEAKDLVVMTVLVPPRLTTIERALVGAVPENLSEIHIKAPSVAWTTIQTIVDIARARGAGEENGEGPADVWGRLRGEGPADVWGRLRGEGPADVWGRLRGILSPFGQQEQQQTTVQQVQNQQDDTKQQQQQQQQADTKQQQQQQQQQDQGTKQQNQQQQQQQAQQQKGQEQNQNQQQQQQQRQTDQQQQQQQQQDKQNNDRQKEQNQVQNQQERQAQGQGRQEQHGQRVHQDAATKQQREWNKPMDDLMQGLTFKPFDRERYATILESIDFEAMDATQSVRELLRIREALLRQGLA